MDKEEKYTDIRDKLRNLEQVKAGENFVHNLNSRIVDIESAKRKVHEKKYDETKGGFLRNLLGNMQYPWLVPAAGFTILIFFIFYITYLSKNASESINDPLSGNKQEITEQKNIPSERSLSAENENPSVTDTDKTRTEKENHPGKDIAGDMKTEISDNQPAPTANNKTESDRGGTRTYKQERKTVTPGNTENSDPEATEDLKDQPGNDTESGRSENNGMISAEKESAVSPEVSRSSVLSESQIQKDQKENMKSKNSGNDSLKKTLNDKLKTVNSESLEKLREEIEK